MKQNRQFRKICLGVSVALILAQILYLVLGWDSLPSQIPAHYNLAGQIDRWGSKLEMLILPLLSLLLLILLEIVGRHPNWWNIPAQVTDKNRGPLEMTIGRFLAVLEVLIMGVFALLFFSGVHGNSLPVWFAPAIVLGTVVFSISGILITIRTADRYR